MHEENTPLESSCQPSVAQLELPRSPATAEACELVARCFLTVRWTAGMAILRCTVCDVEFGVHVDTQPDGRRICRYSLSDFEYLWQHAKMHLELGELKTEEQCR